MPEPDENPETFPTMDPGNGKFPKQIVGLNGKYYRFLHVQLNYLFFHEKWGFLVPRPEVPRQGLFGETRSGAAIVVVLARNISSLYPPSFLEVLGWERIEFLHGHWTSVASTCRCSGGVLVSQTMWFSLKLRGYPQKTRVSPSKTWTWPIFASKILGFPSLDVGLPFHATQAGVAAIEKGALRIGHRIRTSHDARALGNLLLDTWGWCYHHQFEIFREDTHDFDFVKKVDFAIFSMIITYHYFWGTEMDIPWYPHF